MFTSTILSTLESIFLLTASISIARAMLGAQIYAVWDNSYLGSLGWIELLASGLSGK